MNCIRQNSVVPIANRPAKAATIAKTLSSVLIAAAAAGAGMGRCGGRWDDGPLVAGAAANAAFGAAWLIAGAAGAAEGAPAGAAGPPAGSVGNLIVGAAEGFGGKLMRTVSFLGWTFAPSGGFGGVAPPGRLGMFSAINLFKAN